MLGGEWSPSLPYKYECVIYSIISIILSYIAHSLASIVLTMYSPVPVIIEAQYKMVKGRQSTKLYIILVQAPCSKTIHYIKQPLIFGL